MAPGDPTVTKSASSTFGHYGGTEPVPRHWFSAFLASSVIYAALGVIAAVVGIGARTVTTETPVDVKFVETIAKEEPPPPPPKPIEEAKPPPPAVPKDMKVRKINKLPPKEIVAPAAMPQEVPQEADPSLDKGLEVWEPDAAELEAGFKGGARKEEITEQLKGVVKAKPLKTNEPPEYPKAARNAGKTATVTLKIRITTGGRVENIEVVEGEEPFLTAAIDAVKKWRYQPAQYNGKAISVHRIIKIGFKLN